MAYTRIHLIYNGWFLQNLNQFAVFSIYEF
jgi:hypothetical protein